MTSSIREPRVRADIAKQLAACSLALEAGAEQEGVVWVELDGPTVEPRTLLSLIQPEDGALDTEVVVWECGQERWLGWGVAAEVRAPSSAAENRFDAVRTATLASRVVSAGGSKDSVPPRWFGGFAFDEPQVDASSSGPDGGGWGAFGSGAFVLPQISVRRSKDRTSWFLALGCADLGRGVNCDPGARLSWLWDQIEAAPVHAASLRTATSPLSERSWRCSSDWEAGEAESRAFGGLIQEVVDLIEAGDAQKIVAADQSVLSLSGSPRLDQVMAAWAEAAPESTRFLFCRGGVAFLGATPERLVQRQGSRVVTQALAGTLPKRRNGALLTDGGAEAASEQCLLTNPKEQHEHGFVVRHIVEHLQPLCHEVTVEDRPRILELRDMLHLQTPIVAELSRPLHVLDLVKALHPTPAVCGLPTAVAQDWIREREVAPRGWYSGPVGWFDATGDGDFFVALRSMLLSARAPTEHGLREGAAGWTQARLFAGVGLVAGSVVECEQREVATKLLTAGRTIDAWVVCDTPAASAPRRQ